MIDPSAVPFYNLDQWHLEEFACFCVLVAGKKASYTAKKLDELLRFLHEETSTTWMHPFMAINRYPAEYMTQLLKSFGIGCYSLKAQSLTVLAASGISLRYCTTDELERIPGIGPKTSRFFILHTRFGARIAILDTHILKYMRSIGMESIPTSTPSGQRYRKLEQQFLGLADESGLTPAEFDIHIWNHYANGTEL